jgi:thiosulfate/3-mercaptopyruvate sulfurtransferase
MRRRDFFPMLSFPVLGMASSALHLGPDSEPKDPWEPADLMEPEELAQILKEAKRPKIISVAFPVLYRQRHIPGAVPAGPTNKSDGISLLTSAVSKYQRDAEIVVYCGCCPLVHCPNVRPAYATLRQLKFTRVRVLNLPNSFRKDWEDKGFPVEPERK